MSVVRQKDCKYEIIIADDGSKDSYLDELKKWTSQFKDILFKYSFLNINQGTVGNLLQAVSISSGLFVKIISPGDYLFDENTLSKFLQYQKKTNADLIAGNFIYYQDGPKLVRDRLPHCLQSYSSKKMMRNILAFNDHFNGAALILRRDIIHKCLRIVNGTVRFAEDISIVDICLLENYKVMYYSLPMVWYEFGTGISTVKKVSSPMRLDSEALWNLLSQRYSGQSFDKIYHDRKIALDDNISVLSKVRVLKGYFNYTVFSYFTYIYKCLVFAGRLIKKKRLLNQLNDISSV